MTGALLPTFMNNSSLECVSEVGSMAKTQTLFGVLAIKLNGQLRWYNSANQLNVVWSERWYQRIKWNAACEITAFISTLLQIYFDFFFFFLIFGLYYDVLDRKITFLRNFWNKIWSVNLWIACTQKKNLVSKEMCGLIQCNYNTRWQYQTCLQTESLALVAL